MNSPLFDMSQYQSATNRGYSNDWRDATESDPAWDVPDLELNLEIKTDEPDGNAPTGWQIESEFTITLESGQTVQGNFIPCLEGEHRMHQFDFTGPVSTTGFKSHFVLAVEAEKYPHPRDYAQAYIYALVTRFEASQKQQAKGKKRASVTEAQAPRGQATDNDSSRREPTMAKDETTDSSRAKVEVVEELSPEEEADRQRLELKVERAFHEAGCSLRELRDRRLYRNTHRNWEQYCEDRFGYTYRFANLKISAADVFDNLLSTCSQARLGTICSQILPTRESQCRELAKLEPEQQPEAWVEAIARTPGKKIPSASTVKAVVLEKKGVVEHLKQKNPSPPEFTLGNVVEIKATKRSPLHPFDGMWGTIEHVGSFSYTVRVSITKDVQQCKGEEMTRIDDEYTANIRAVARRIEWLVRNFELEPIEYDILANLQRSRCFTPKQMRHLETIEGDYDIKFSPGN